MKRNGSEVEWRLQLDRRIMETEMASDLQTLVVRKLIQDGQDTREAEAILSDQLDTLSLLRAEKMQLLLERLA